MTQLVNQFAQSPELGQLDMKMNTSTIPCQVDASEGGALVPGQAVKLVDSAGGVPKVVAVASDDDQVFGFVIYDPVQKSSGYVAGDALEVSTIYGNVMYLKAVGAVARGSLLKIVQATVGGVAVTNNGDGDKIVGWAFDKAANDELLRVVVNCPSFFVS